MLLHPSVVTDPIAAQPNMAERDSDLDLFGVNTLWQVGDNKEDEMGPDMQALHSEATQVVSDISSSDTSGEDSEDDF